MTTYRELQGRAFDVAANVDLQLLGSAELARAMGVPEEQILQSVEDADAYFLGTNDAMPLFAREDGRTSSRPWN